ncbi:MAG: hypothetical protein HND48_15935 [Chloroflexi bacterium]|nr:hypothetical protein [Chloroflexota bacterium]
MNFAHRYPLFSVSIAFKVDGVTEWGAVHVPALGEPGHRAARTWRLPR